MKEFKVIKAWCDSQIEYYKDWENEKEYNDAKNELQLLHTLSKMLDSAIEENQIPAGAQLCSVVAISNRKLQIMRTSL